MATSPVEHQPLLAQPVGRLHKEAAAQVTDEALDLALHRGTTELAQPGPEAGIAGKVQEAGLETVTPATVGVPLHNDGTHVVLKHLARHDPEGQERILKGGDQRLEAPVGGQPQLGRPAPA